MRKYLYSLHLNTKVLDFVSDVIPTFENIIFENKCNDSNPT